MGFEEQASPFHEASGLVQEPAGPEGAPEGGYGAQDDIVFARANKPTKPKQKKGLNIIPALLSLFVPWFLFVVVYAVTSFSLHYSSPFGCWIVVMICAALVIAGYAITALSALRGKDPTWYGFLSTLMFIAVVLGASLGTINFVSNLRPYYDSSNLNKYDNVDPGEYSGQQMMDAGQINFVKGVSPDRSKAMGFRDRDMYCVTPITKSAGVAPASGFYDFWAVGINCCSGAPHEFHCSEYDNKYAHSGLRLVDQDKQAFYRLAVQQAEAAYSISAPHPIFVHWLQDPNAELDAYADEGMMYYLIGIFSHLAFQVVAVGVGVVVIARIS
mmetsp:Transcript_42510/g.98536  ORF Transcript_42510/g.98536 Transcript_42510/m.98536 type:complete len:328 (+) Transcript_42510:85-1068(+)|eukprot:CAMPEP_0171094190 /NCGR_PEP_ID=MMETSP0766_2-20121228/40251_1 /TAXON_ID=439317 /ORGANISM="Gambierdiscus australes, Strain CAWD 149" /LENGTH=327 /DNA_ID=CAMNT_0011552767 /DNA_START=85 /DNA_END=1068 /DNA_ORIENTATION=+